MSIAQRRDDLEWRFPIKKGFDLQPCPLMQIEQKHMTFLIRSGGHDHLDIVPIQHKQIDAVDLERQAIGRCIRGCRTLQAH